jgi:hypothetical protein
MLEYLKTEPEDMRLVAKARELVQQEKLASAVKMPAELVDSAKRLFRERHTAECPHCHKAITPFKKKFKHQWFLSALWFLLAAAGFGLSFVFPRYFVQCVALGTLAGLKWVLDQRAIRSQVLIYKALKDDESQRRSDRDLHHIPTEL